MARYLVAFVFTPMSNVELFPQVYKLNFACAPDEVTLPANTVFFHFVSTAVDTTEEVQSAFLGMRVGMVGSISCSIPLEIENDKHYFVEKLQTFYGIEFICNPETKTRIPSQVLSNINYEVIDL